MIMKTINKYMTVVLFAASVFCTVSCDDPQPIEPVTPAFPELVENLAVQAGDTLALTFTPNLDWEVTVPKDTMDFFWLIDGGFQYEKISRKASEEAVTVYVGVGKADFENHTSTVKLTMGGETRIIASYMLPALEKSIKIQSCQVDEYGSWLFDENGGYLYTSEEPEVINLVYSGSDFRIPVKVTSNFEYTIEFPTWARADIPEKTVGENEFSIYGVPSEYPLTETSDKIVIKSGSEVIAEYQIAIPGCSDILSYGVELVSSIKFNELGQYLTLVNFMEGPVNAWVTGVENVKVFAVEKVDGKYAVDGNAPAWLDITLSAYDNSDGADVLQQRSVQVSLKKYTSDSEALLFFLPPTGWDKVSDLFNEDATEVKEEWAASAVNVSVKEYSYVTVADAEGFAGAGGNLEESQDEALIKIFGSANAAQYAYVMTYGNPYASDNGRLLFKEPFTSFEVYDSSLTLVEDTENFFLSFTCEEDMKSGVVNMTGDLKKSGYIVFKNDEKKIIAIIQCDYDVVVIDESEKEAEDRIVDASRYLKDPQKAAAAGVSAVEYEYGATRFECEEARTEGAILIKVTAPVNSEVELNVPKSAKLVVAYKGDAPELPFEFTDFEYMVGGAYISQSTLGVKFLGNYKESKPSVKFYNANSATVLVVYFEEKK